MNVYESILDTIGNTPLVNLNRIFESTGATILAKCEFLNPGGSIKDRIGLQIIEDAERKGLLKPGSIIVEGTSGNTGIGLAMAASLKGYKAILVMPDKMSEEKVSILEAFGADVVITPTNVEHDDPRSYISVSHKIVKETPNAIFADQFFNPTNPQTHYKTTGPEIWNATSGKITHFVAGIGTGGTISGTGKYLKEMNPEIKIIGVDPFGSVYHDNYYSKENITPFSYLIEGIGEDVLPGTLDFEQIDRILQVNDADSFHMTKRLVKEEGMFCGGSSGSAVCGVEMIQNDLSNEDIVVVILPDSGSRYQNKIYSDKWMKTNNFTTG